jgi:hypothetical protein
MLMNMTNVYDLDWKIGVDKNANRRIVQGLSSANVVYTQREPEVLHLLAIRDIPTSFLQARRIDIVNGDQHPNAILVMYGNDFITHTVMNLEPEPPGFRRSPPPLTTTMTTQRREQQYEDEQEQQLQERQGLDQNRRRFLVRHPNVTAVHVMHSDPRFPIEVEITLVYGIIKRLTLFPKRCQLEQYRPVVKLHIFTTKPTRVAIHIKGEEQTHFNMEREATIEVNNRGFKHFPQGHVMNNEQKVASLCLSNVPHFEFVVNDDYDGILSCQEDYLSIRHQKYPEFSLYKEE